MNLVQDIVDRFSGDLLGNLSSVVGEDEDSTGYAAQAAVPALLAGLSSMASNSDGARKLTSALNGLGSSSMDDVAGMLRGDAGAVAQRGSNLLNSLFGDNVVGNLAGMLGRYSGLASDAVRKLLALVAPMVLGKVASAWKSKGGTPQALTSLFAEQRQHIAEAMPAGVSLADLPGWSNVKQAAAATADAGRGAAATAGTATRSAATWAIPLALGALGLLLVWALMRPRDDEAAKRADRSTKGQEVTAQKPVVAAESAAAEITRVNDDLSSIFTTAGDVMGEITDAASAEAARPKLEALSQQIDDTKTALDRLPATGVASVRTTAEKSIATIKDQATRMLELPGLTAELKELINRIVRKLAELFAPATP
jgi:hypothetical protein